MLSGPYGSGESHLAYAVASACLRAGHVVHVTTVPDLRETLRRGYSRQADDSFERRYDAITRADLLVLDDLGGGTSVPDRRFSLPPAPAIDDHHQCQSLRAR